MRSDLGHVCNSTSPPPLKKNNPSLKPHIFLIVRSYAFWSRGSRHGMELGLNLAGVVWLSSMCSSECFRLITESNNAVKSKSGREEGKQGSFFIELIRRLAKTTCNRNKTQARKKLISGLFYLKLELKQLLPRANWSLKWLEGSFLTLKTYLQLLNGSDCPCCL